MVAAAQQFITLSNKILKISERFWANLIASTYVVDISIIMKPISVNFMPQHFRINYS